jgi:arylsulfate sulfotransferase
VSFFSADRFTPGAVSSTANPLVVLYNFSAPQGASMQVNFGTTTNYGLNTWSQPAPANGGNVGILVAGMRASTTYHMQAVVTLADGTQVRDADQTFTTGALPADSLPNITVQQTPGITPGDGVELLDLFQHTTNNQLTALATDLEGNVIWYYPIQPTPPFPIKLLPNGHMLVVTYTLVSEIDLAGNVIYALPLVQVASNLAAQGIPFPPFNLFSHDIVKLPNGHYLLLIDFTATDVPGNPSIAADAIIDWDPKQHSAVWTWNALDHIPLSHAPNGTTDWTHANALLYSPDDGNLLVSMRNQNWIVKINYADGAGDGRILWHLGPQGDFHLPAGVTQLEWNYGQHYPVFLSPNTAGIFSLLFFNNGNGRYEDSDDDECSTPGFPACYSSVPVFQLDESTNTVQVLQEYNLAPVYSACCGSVGELSNGDMEYDIAQDLNNPEVSTVQEVTQPPNPQLVWQMTISGELAYRAFRIPSLYPGVTWSQSDVALANAAARPASPKAASPRH